MLTEIQSCVAREIEKTMGSLEKLRSKIHQSIREVAKEEAKKIIKNLVDNKE
jgi:hypothetical protein